MNQAVCEGIITSELVTGKSGSRQYTRADISYNHPMMKDDEKQKITTWLLEFGVVVKLRKGDRVRVYGTFCRDPYFSESKMKMIVSEYEQLNQKAQVEEPLKEEQMSLF
jgi:DNA replicative helicase MCM subunit Mcm2 (Cdc46/Mcm family)